MFEPFAGNYVWNLSTNLALMCGGNIGEIDVACRAVREAAERGANAGTAAFFDAWVGLAHQVKANAEVDEAAGRRLSAAAKYGRASGYLLAAERMQARDYAPRWDAYRLGLELFRKRVTLAGEPCEFVEIPYEGRSYPALFVPAPATAEGPAPCVVSCNGLDSMKEQIYSAGNAEAFRRRGVSTLLVDQPGTGEALRLRGLTGVFDAEKWGSAAYHYLLTRSDVDHARIGMFGLSLGGYFAPRIAAKDPRFVLCAILGANHHWGDLQHRRRKREGENPVPHYWDHVMWVFGQPDVETFLDWSSQMSLVGVADEIRAPFLVTHGRNDRQIPVADAQISFDAAKLSPKRELRIFEFTDYEVEHCGADNGTVARDFIADWISETFQELKA